MRAGHTTGRSPGIEGTDHAGHTPQSPGSPHGVTLALGAGTQLQIPRRPTGPPEL